MERLGFIGIIKLTIHILLRHLQHFLCIALLLALPNALTSIVVGPFGQVLQKYVASISLLYKISSNEGGALNPSDLTPSEKALINQQQDPPPPFLVLLLSILSVCISLVCTILVTFSVCRACLNKSLDLKGSLRGVPRSAWNLFLTGLLVAGMLLVLGLLGLLGMVIVAAGLSAVKAISWILITLIAIGMVGGVVYMTIAFSLAGTVAILEEKKGWEAMSKSTRLIKGSRWTVVGLFGLNGVMTMLVILCLGTVEMKTSVVWTWVATGVSLGLQAFLGVYVQASTVVLYMSCKSGQGEALETLAAASSHFGPLESAASKYLDLETAAFATTSTQ